MRERLLGFDARVVDERRQPVGDEVEIEQAHEEDDPEKERHRRASGFE